MRGGSGFNPRPRAGGDGAELEVLYNVHAVSIHAPAQGATIFSPKDERWIMFQSTPPRRGRLELKTGGTNGDSFNPRPRAGGDGRGETKYWPAIKVSIHAPAQGATVYLCK